MRPVCCSFDVAQIVLQLCDEAPSLVSYNFRCERDLVKSCSLLINPWFISSRSCLMLGTGFRSRSKGFHDMKSVKSSRAAAWPRLSGTDLLFFRFGGDGLGNLLFPWARCMSACRLMDGKWCGPPGLHSNPGTGKPIPTTNVAMQGCTSRCLGKFTVCVNCSRFLHADG